MSHPKPELADRLVERLIASRKEDVLSQPILFNASDTSHAAQLLSLLETGAITRVVDTYDEQVDELVSVDRPARILERPMPSAALEGSDTWREGVWVYYPWRSTLVHCLSAVDFRRLRLSRNRHLITAEEEAILAQLTIGVVGLNVGNPGAICLGLEGIGQTMKLADFDTLSVTNLNRFRAGLPDLGVNKATLSARQLGEIDPFLNIELFASGIDPANLEQFLLQPKIDVLIEEMDQLPLKISIREAARQARLPVVMVTGNGEDIIIDVERFDLDPDLPLLNGFLTPDVQERIAAFNPAEDTITEKITLARDFMGVEFLHSRLVHSFSEIGVSVAGIPQLAEASFLRGAALCYIIRRIFTHPITPSGRYRFQWSTLAPVSPYDSGS